MEDQDKPLGYRKRLGEKDIDRYRNGNSCNDKQCTMPLLRLIVRVVEGDKALDYRARDEGQAHNGALPSYGKQPAWIPSAHVRLAKGIYIRLTSDVAEILLAPARRKLGNPMILTARGRGPTSMLISKFPAPNLRHWALYMEAISAMLR